MAFARFEVLVLVALFIQHLAVVSIGFVEEVGVADSDVVEGGLLGKLSLQLGIEIFVDG